MTIHQDLIKAWQMDGRRRPVHRQPELTEDGLVLGAGIVIAKAGRDVANRPVLNIDGQEPRILALLSVAYHRPMTKSVLNSLRLASRNWSKGEPALAQIVLAQAGLGNLSAEGGGEDEDAVLRLFVVDQLMKSGKPADEILEDFDLLPKGVRSWQWQKWAKENPNRIPAGCPEGGQYCSADGAGTASLDLVGGSASALISMGTNAMAMTADDDKSANSVTRKNGVTVTHQPGGDWVVADYEKITAVAGPPGTKYYGQCVSLVKEATGMPATSEWRAGASISGYGDPPLQPGTVIATMDENGRYPGPEDDDKHAAIFMGYGVKNGQKGMWVYDQYRSSLYSDGVKPPSRSFIPFDEERPYVQNASSYSVVTTQK